MKSTIPPTVPGARYGRWLVLSAAEPQARSDGYGFKPRWLCRCACGTERIVLQEKLRNSWSQSCGCLFRDRAQERRTVHGQCRTPEYLCWQSMHSRCSDPTNTSWANYGGRGITVCDRWSDFALFLADMGPRPSPDYSIDRIDNAAGYCPENCRWATRKEQSRNKRRNRWLTYQGETLTLTDWAARVGIHLATLSNRLRSGWSVEDALTLPRQPGGRGFRPPSRR